MINWEKGNPFLYEWMLLILQNPPKDWGQKVPTEMLLSRLPDIPDSIQIVPQHSLLLHPAFGHQQKFGYPSSKGPMFPPYDLRIPGLPDYDEMISFPRFWDVLYETLSKHPDYCCVKNSKNIGILQSFRESRENSKRWFIGFLADPLSIDRILYKIDKMNEEIITFSQKNIFPEKHFPRKTFFDTPESQMGVLPYRNYNCSILRLSGSDGVLVTFFVAFDGQKYGTMSWAGIILYDAFLRWVSEPDYKIDPQNWWIMQPRLIQNDLGPKCADLRLFKTSKNIGVVGYTRVAPLSNTPNIPDYYARAAMLDFCSPRIPILHKKLLHKKLLHKKHIDGGCFPSTIGADDLDPFLSEKIISDTNISEKIIPEIRDNQYSKPIVPHRSKCRDMPNNMKLNGIEISFSENDRNEDPATHVSRKNIVPLQHFTPLDNDIACFVDFSPHDLVCNNGSSLITVQDMTKGDVLYTGFIQNVVNVLRGYRGSTPVVQLRDGKWLTILHRRSDTLSRKPVYEYVLVLYDFLELKKLNISIPHRCICIHPLSGISAKNEFIYITGIIPLEYNDGQKLDVIISYGISDKASGVQRLSFVLPQ